MLNLKFGKRGRHIPAFFERLRPAANRLARRLIDLRLRRRFRAAPAGTWPVARNLAFHLRTWYRRQPDAGRPEGPHLVEVFPAERVPLIRPRTLPMPRPYRPELPQARWLNTPADFAVVLPNGRFDGRLLDVITATGELLTEVTFHGPAVAYREAEARLQFPPRPDTPRHVAGNVAAIASLYAGLNYFHWLFNAFPRFEILRRAGLPPDRMDGFILDAPPHPYQMETLECLGISLDKLIICTPEQHLIADRLWATKSLRSSAQSRAWVVDLLRRSFLDETPPGRLRLYVSRADTPRHPLVNEPEIETWLAKRGFQVVLPRQLSIREQARLFAQAEVVVGPNGAGLANLVFCPPGTKVFELFSPDWLSSYTWELCSRRRQDYYYLIGELSNQSSELAAYSIAIADLARLLSLAGLAL